MAFTDLPVRRSIPMGVAAYLIGYLATVGATIASGTAIMQVTVTGEYVDSATLGEIFGTTPSPWITGGWLFYNAQFIPTSVPTADSLNGFASLTNRLLLLDVNGLLLGLFIIPFLLLLTAGYLTVQTGKPHGVRGATFGGASVAIGYLPLLLIGAFVFTAKAPNAMSVASPDGLLTVFIGLSYSMVVGAIGGKMAEDAD